MAPNQPPAEPGPRASPAPLEVGVEPPPHAEVFLGKNRMVVTVDLARSGPPRTAALEGQTLVLDVPGAALLHVPLPYPGIITAWGLRNGVFEANLERL